jgi:Protein of unknown function (DUF3352)
MSRVRSMRFLPGLVAALAVAFGAAGCGGGGGGGAGGEAAGIVPEGAALYVSGDTDFEGDQWQTAADLVRKFPDGEKAISDLLADFESQEGVDFEEDIKPAVGPEVAVAVLEFPTDGASPPIVALTQPDDEQKLQVLLEKGSEPTVSEQVGGWTVISDQQSSIDRFKEMRGDGVLADSEDFQDAMEGLESDSLVSLYVGGEALGAAARSDPQFSQAGLDAFLPGGKIPSIGAILRAEDNGARLDGQAVFAGDVTESGLVSGMFEAKLPEEVPADVLAYFSFNDLESQFSTFRDSLSEIEPDFDRQLGQAEAFLGVSLEEDIAPLFAGEGAVYVRRGAPIPEITLLTTVEDEQKALGTLDDLVAGLGRFVPVEEPTRVEIGGVEAREVPIQPPFSLFYAAFDGRLVVTSSRQGIEDLREDGDRFADEEAFTAAAETAGLPGETTGWGYVNLEQVLPLVLDFAAAGDAQAPPEVRTNTEPLRSLVFWGTAEDRTARFSLFLGLE